MIDARLSALLLIVGLTETIAAHPAPTPTVEHTFMVGLPNELFGARKLVIRHTPTVSYLPSRIGIEPTTVITPTRVTKISSINTLRDDARTAVRGTGNLEVVAEGTFTSPLLPDAVGVYGEYNTDVGFTQSWLIEHDGSRIFLVTRMLRIPNAEIQRARAEVSVKVFGGAAITLQGKANSR